MRQYEKIKSQYPNVIVLFRVGDFYETFNNDAVQVSNALGIVLTKRSNGAASDVPLAGFPHHVLESYIAKLVKKGFRVAVCDQMEDPKFARGIVKREVVDVITPGVNFSERLLDEKKNNYLCAIHFGSDTRSEGRWNNAFSTNIGIAFIDVTTAEFQAADVSLSDLSQVLQSVLPSEIIISKKEKEHKALIQEALGKEISFTELDEWLFSIDYAEQTLLSHFKTHSLKGYGIEHLHSGKIASSVIVNYLEETQRIKLQYINRISKFETGDVVTLDVQTKRNLEILYSLNDRAKNGTLIEVLDKSSTPMGSRLFKKWISRPSKNTQLIQERLDSVEELKGAISVQTTIVQTLKKICDLERALSRVATHRANPREVVVVGRSLEEIPPLKALLKDLTPKRLCAIYQELDDCRDISDMIMKALSSDAPGNTSEGGVIREGYNHELDEYRHVSNHAKDKLIEIQQEEREKTGIASLKVLYNKVFGYYIEISNANKAKVPSNYERKQTMVNAERFTIPILKELEQKILTAEEKMGELEQRLFAELRQRIALQADRLQHNASLIAELDCLTSLAQCAQSYGYTKPIIHENDSMVIRGGRHPVLEHLLPEGEKYVPNDCALNFNERVLIITGPNMAGKSSYLRQTGLIILLAQIGSFVPADYAEIGIVDKIFTRVGASDNLAAGESTFLVEMNETANILNNATEKSLILLDEIGRGTSTYDGMSIAWAMTEYIHNQIGAKTLFATHYHELAALESHLPRLKNFNATVAEKDDKIIFLRTIERGAADNSYGIEVAKMAGMPSSVILRAKEILAQLEEPISEHEDELLSSIGKDGRKTLTPNTVNNKVKRIKPKEPSFQISLFEMSDSKLKAALSKIDINKLTPVEAMLKLAELKRISED